MKKPLEAVKNFCTELIEGIVMSDRDGFKIHVSVLSHSIVYTSGDHNSEPRYFTRFAIEDPEFMEDYGADFDIESEFYYMSTRKNDRLVLWVKKNPKYDPNDMHSQKLILADP